MASTSDFFGTSSSILSTNVIGKLNYPSAQSFLQRRAQQMEANRASQAARAQAEKEFDTRPINRTEADKVVEQMRSQGQEHGFLSPQDSTLLGSRASDPGLYTPRSFRRLEC